MTDNQTIRGLFASNIDRRIEEVIKVDQTDEEIICAEIAEYVVTDAIRRQYIPILDRYAETPNKPHEGVGVWVSGFFGSGKSSFAKMLGLSIDNRLLEGTPASQRFADRAGDNRLTVLLKTIAEKIPTHAVIFDVSTDKGIKSGNQTLTEIMYRLFLQSLGYSKDLDLSELEIALEQEGRLQGFERAYLERFGKEWNADKGLVAFSIGRASEVMHILEPSTYPSADSWMRGIKDRADITPGRLAERANELMKRRRPGQSLIFVIDEVGQFVARDVQKMLDLQGVVQNLGMKGRGKHWLVVTSQEKLGEMVSGLDDKRIELARLMDRFPQEMQVHLEPSDISEVTSRRVLSKNAAAQTLLGQLFDQNRGRLDECTRLTADIRLPELTRQGFIDLYPLLPYEIDLVIQVVSGLRTQGGASKHVGGANRTIIKLAQQLLINPAVDLAGQDVGSLVRLDQIYDLVEGSIASEVRAKIESIPNVVPNAHPMALRVAKAICLLQFVKSVHRTPENIAACLHPNVTAGSQLPDVKAALAQLEAARLVRNGDDGYRIPTPAEDDWERARIASNPTPGDTHRLLAEAVESFWQPQPSYSLLGARTFKAGLTIGGRPIVAGEIAFQVELALDAVEYRFKTIDLRARSQQERSTVFWAVVLNEAIDREAVEAHRSKDVLSRKEHDARTGAESTLIGEEKLRLRRHQEELRRLLRAAMLSGNVYFRGNDRSPSEGATDVGKSVISILDRVVPDIFDRFHEAAAKQTDVKKGLDALLDAANLQGLPPVFASLKLLGQDKGKVVFALEEGPLHEVLARIRQQAEYGQTASGRSLADEFEKEPFGWDFEVVRLLVLSLLRSGSIVATSKGQTFETATGPEAHETFANNNLFRSASFRPSTGAPPFEDLVKANLAFRDTFGLEFSELNVAPMATQLREQIELHEDAITQAFTRLTANQLAGATVLEAALSPMRAILRGSDTNAVSTFSASHASIKDAVKRASELAAVLSEKRLDQVHQARQALRQKWAFLATEADITEDLRDKAAALEDTLERETFFREFPVVEQSLAEIEAEYQKRHVAALVARAHAYGGALERLTQAPDWLVLPEEQRKQLAAPLEGLSASSGQEDVPIPQLRSDLDACPARMSAAVTEVRRILDGARLVEVSLDSYFAGGIETEEQLTAALDGIHEECSRLIGAGKKIIAR